MKNIILATIMGFSGISSVFAECAYSFDATLTQLQSLGNTSVQKFPTITGNKFSYKTSQQSSVYMAFSQDYLSRFLAANDSSAMLYTRGDKVIPTSGIIAFEYKIKVPTLVNTGYVNIFPTLAAGIMQNGKAVNFIVAYQHGPTVNNFYIKTTSNDSTVVSDLFNLAPEVTSDGFQKIGIYINQNSNQVGLVFNGVNKGYFATFPSKLDNLYFSLTSNFFDLAATDANKDVSIEFLLDKSKITQTYPKGTKDICGVAL
ncbi:DUF4882 family protein [Acinetobacter baumannii]|nr:DUF4882 domain-containing protein [Acinetobacter baumannii]MDC4723800.1 DUF4882 domain-containing protein [Acinetobacter baumannii]MDC5417123.1 DUF4882 domain-containing protein [Acinetobacter baumannii]MDV7541703.1 DUF4882 family protein [Acinetobacter baumannii]